MGTTAQVLLVFGSPLGKDRRQRGERSIPPDADLVRMDPILSRNLADRLFSFDRLQGDFGLHRRVVMTSHAVHCTMPPFLKRLALMHLHPLSSFWGEAQVGDLRSVLDSEDHS